MEATLFITASIIFTIAFILIMRLLGAWMLRINIIIRELKEIKEVLKTGNTMQRESSIRLKGKEQLTIEEKARLFDASNAKK